MRTFSEREPEADMNERMGRCSTSSEMVVMDDRTIADTAHTVPVNNLNISRSSRVHIGPKFVSVTQNISNDEIVKGRILGLDLVSKKRARRLRCSIAVFVCWAFIVACGLAFYLIHVALLDQQTRLDIGLRDPWYLRRDDWQAMPAYSIEHLNLPLKYALIGHTAGPYCNQKYSCIEQVLIVQKNHFERRFDDIGPNFLVGGNGFIFEGRGANVVGAMVKSWNTKSITIMFLGDYTTASPDQAQFDHVNVLLEQLVKKHVLHPDYELLGHCQVATRTVSPGPNIMQKLNIFLHWNSTNANTCLPK